MSDGSLKQIKDIKREDEVMTNLEKKEYKKVAKIITSNHDGELICIPKKLLNNTNDIIITGGHPIWINHENNIYRVYSSNIKGIKIVPKKDTFYNIQFEDEAVYYAEGLKLDSLSPNFCNNKLAKHLFFDKLKYNKLIYIDSEDNPYRNKPRMVSSYPVKELPKLELININIGKTIVPARGGYGAVPRKKM